MSGWYTKAGPNATTRIFNQMVLDNCFVSDDLLAKEKGVCIVKGTRCCMRVNNTGQNQTNLQKMAQQAPVFHNLTQVFNQIPTLNLSMGFIFLTNGGDNYGQVFKLSFIY